MILNWEVVQIAVGQQNNIKYTKNLEIWSGNSKMIFCPSKIEIYYCIRRKTIKPNRYSKGVRSESHQMVRKA